MNRIRKIYQTLDDVETQSPKSLNRQFGFDFVASTGPAMLIGIVVLFQTAFNQQRDNRATLATTAATLPFHAAPGAAPSGMTESAARLPSIPPASVPRLALASIVTGLHTPDGIAIDTVSGHIYVSEEDVGRIVRIDGESIHVVVDSNTPIFTSRAGREAPATALRFPEGLALGLDGTLYVAEDIPGGRLIQFVFDIEGDAAWGREVPLPFGRHDFAWESVAVGPQGELLLAGSTVEHVVASGEPGIFEGLLLYRDESGAWWEAHRRPMVAFSCAAFSECGGIAAYGCEVTGEIGWLDLTQRTLRSAASSHRFRSPEGLCFLPDGTLLIAEEAGQILHLDPATDRVETIQAGLGAIESVAWNPVTREVLVTGDEHGELLRFRVEHVSLAKPVPFRGRFESDETAAYPFIPDTCPVYLEEVLKMAGHDPAEESFADLASRLSILAVDARATLLNEDAGDVDAYDHVQFVIFHPGMMGIDFPGLVAPISGFAARQQSGALTRTVLESREFLHADFATTMIQAMGAGTISIPYAGPAALLNGAAFASFLGLGRTPDFCFNINPYEPEESRMTVLQTNGDIHHYRLDFIESTENRDWVVAMTPKPAARWNQLSAAHHMADMRANRPLQVAALTSALLP